MAPSDRKGPECLGGRLSWEDRETCRSDRDEGALWFRSNKEASMIRHDEEALSFRRDESDGDAELKVQAVRS